MKKYIISGIIILFILVILLGLFLPFFNIRNAIYDETVRNTELNRTSEIIVKDYNPFAPLIIIVPKVGTEELQKQQAGMFIVRYKRTGLTTFKEAGVGEVISQNKTANELVEIAKTQNLIGNNPDKENLIVPCVEDKCPPRQGRPSDEDRYFDPQYLPNERGVQRDLEYMKKLKIGMTWKEVYTTTDKGDRGTQKGIITGGYEKHYKIEKSDGVVFVILNFDKPTYDEGGENAKLLEAKVIYTDRRVEDLPLQQ